eukprot:12259-Heterococcus_DN1.PRE.1
MAACVKQMRGMYTNLVRAAIAVCYIMITRPFVFTAITSFLPFDAKARTLDAPFLSTLSRDITVGRWAAASTNCQYTH